jgi:hypothetical protein
MAEGSARLDENRAVRSAVKIVKRLLALFFVLLGCGLLTLGSALLSGVIFLRGSNLPDAFAWKPPLELVDARALAPETVLLPLTGISASDALNATLDQAHLENAFALLAFDPFLDDSLRLGALLQLGTRYASAKNTRAAAQIFQIAAHSATLSPTLADAARLDAYLQASAELRALGALDAARWTTDQAYRLAAYTPTLQREQRARRLDQVANAYAALGADVLSRQAHTESADAALSATIPITRPRTSFTPTIGKLPPAQVANAQARRIAAAKRLQDDLQERAPKTAREWDADLMGALADALLEEDAARQAYYDQQLAQTQDEAVQLALRRDQIAWLALKYRSARGAFGAPLVAEWQAERATIVDALSAAWDDYFRLVNAQVERLPNLERAPARQDVLLYELFVVRWGLYPAQPEQIVLEELGQVTQELMDAGYPSLRFDSFKRNNRMVFWWVPDELYGRGENALPK